LPYLLLSCTGYNPTSLPFLLLFLLSLQPYFLGCPPPFAYPLSSHFVPTCTSRAFFLFVPHLYFVAGPFASCHGQPASVCQAYLAPTVWAVHPPKFGTPPYLFGSRPSSIWNSALLFWQYTPPSLGNTHSTSLPVYTLIFGIRPSCPAVHPPSLLYRPACFGTLILGTITGELLMAP
jgi:hypothetical protein